MSEEKSFVGHLREFDVKINDWSIFKPRLLNYFTANNIEDPVRKRAILLNLLSEDSYRLIFNLCLPTAPERKTFEELINLFSDHFGTQTSVFAEREKFYSAKKLSSETANDWAARLRNLAAYCEFDEELNIALRDRFIVGYNNGPVMDRLFEERKQISLAEAIRIASSKEAARGKEATPFSLKEEPLFHFRKGSKCAASAKTSPSTSQERMSAQIKCQVCGRSNHLSSNCQYRECSCHFCNTKGHLSPVCPKRQQSETKRIVHNQNKTNRNFKFGKKNYFQNYLDDKQNSLFMIKSIENKPFYVDISINYKNYAFQIDTESSISCINKFFYEKFFPSETLRESDKELFVYTGQKISPIGSFVTNVVIIFTCSRNIQFQIER